MRIKGSLRKILSLLLILVVVAATVDTGPVQDSQQDRLSFNVQPLPARFSARSQAVIDFDGDKFPDRAELTSNGLHKHIHLRFSSPRTTNLSFSTESPQPGSIHAEDIDHDGDNDLIWVSDRQTPEPALWLNSGIGEFKRVANASAYATEINHLVADESRSGLFASFSDDQPLATETPEDSFLGRSEGRLPITPRSITLSDFGRNCAAELSPCITRYPKRGPPAELS
jgi:hypothetical protein